MKRLLLLITICISSVSFGQQTNFEWAKTFGSVDNDQGKAIAVDESGNIYTTGGFQGTVDFDPGTGTFNLSSAGGFDVFIQKLDASGNFLWAKSFGGYDDDFVYDITLDASGNIYTTGSFQGTVDFDPGIGTFNHTCTGFSDAFIQKLDASGNFLWAKAYGGSTVRPRDIKLDASGNIYTTGHFYGTVDFDPGTGTFNLSCSIADHDVFIQKLDASGNFLWAVSFGGDDDDAGLSITIGASGNIYTAGIFMGTVDFDPGPGFGGTFNLTSAGSQDAFIQKLDASGNFLWAKAFGSSSFDGVHDIRLDSSGNIYTAGYFMGTVDFDPGIGTFNLTSAGSIDIFIQKLDVSGNFLWAKSFGGDDDDSPQYIRLDASGNIYTTGYFRGTADFDPGLGTFNLTSAGSKDIFIQKLDASGNFLWAKSFGGSSIDKVSGITLDVSGNIYTTGYFYGTVDFDPGIDTFNLTSVGSFDVFVHRLSPCSSNSGIDVQTACDSYQWIDGQTYTVSNNSATVTLTNASGCDSTVTLNLTINNSNTGSETITECDSYTWSTNGQTYTESGQYTEILSNQSGCDSTVTLDLTINSSSSSTQTQTGIDSYTWSVNNETYTESGTYTAVIPNVVGCDSTITLELTLEFVGLDENESSYVAVYPNPTCNSFILSTKDMTNMKYTLLDIKGKVVLTGKIESTEEKVDISNLSRGQYNLVFEDESISPISIIKN